MAIPAMLRRFAEARVMVVGDVMLDEYLWGNVERISPEAPVPVVHMRRQSDHLGGAANVSANIRALGGKSLTVGLVGDDPAAEQLRSLFRSQRLGTSGLLTTRGMPTTRKVRIIGQQQQLIRVDFEDMSHAEAMNDALIRRCLRSLGRHRCVVLSDYGKGVITAPLIQEIVRGCLKRDVRIVVDPKVEHFGLYENVDLITPNHIEAGLACGIKITDQDSLHAAGDELLRLTNARGVLITRGSEGMSLFRRSRKPLHIPTEAREVFDVSGAGDTVVATLSLALAAGEDLEMGSRLANRAAGIVVGKLGTATVSPEELADSLKRRPLAKRRGR